MHSFVYLFLIFSVFGAKVYIDEQHPNIVDIGIFFGPQLKPYSQEAHVQSSPSRILKDETSSHTSNSNLKWYDKAAYILSPLHISVTYPAQKDFHEQQHSITVTPKFARRFLCNPQEIKQKFNAAATQAEKTIFSKTTFSEEQFNTVHAQPLITEYQNYCDSCQKFLNKEDQQDIEQHGEKLYQELRKYYALKKHLVSKTINQELQNANDSK